MSYLFELTTDGKTFKVAVAFLPKPPFHDLFDFKPDDMVGFWRCLPGYMALSKGGCTYEDTWRDLTLWDQEPSPGGYASDLYGSATIAQLTLPRSWDNLMNGDSGKVIYYPHGARITNTRSIKDGYWTKKGEWTAKEGFAGSFIRHIAEAAKKAAQAR